MSCFARPDRALVAASTSWRRGLLAIAVTAVFPVVAAAATPSEAPNILFLFADDWGRYASILAETDSPGGPNEIARTPHFDRVARAGVLFRNAHVSAPSCTPCRSALLTGQHFWRTGSAAILQGAVWNDTLPSFPPLLEQAGYHIGYAHKVWGPGTPANAPFEARHNYGRQGGRFNQFSQHATQLVASGRSIDEAKGELLDEVRANFRSFLAARRDGQPFLWWFGPTNVHRKWVKGSGKALWGIDPDTLEGRLPAPLPDVPEVREDFADYLGEIAAWDAAIGVILAELDAAGARDDTLVVISGDHGPPGFPHGKCNLYAFGTGVCLSITGPGVRGGRVVDDMTSLTDLAPTFLEAAGLPVPEVMTGRSLWPVLEAEGSGLVDPARTQVFTGRERHVAGARADFAPYPQRAIRTPTHALIVNFHPERWPLGDPFRLDEAVDPSVDQLENDTFVTLPDEDAGPTKAWLVRARKQPEWAAHFDWVYGRRPRVELYDVVRDPDETTNLADDPASVAVVADLERRLREELARTRDPRLVNEGAFFETPPLAGPLAPDQRRPRARAGGDGKPQPAGSRTPAAGPRPAGAPAPAAGSRPGVAPVSTGRWPQFRGPGAAGAAAADPRLPDAWDAASRNNIAWFREVPGRGWSSPIVWDGIVYLTTAIAADELEAPRRGLYFGGARKAAPDTSLRWVVLALDAATGTVRWEREVAAGPAPEAVHLKNSFASETPVTDGARVYASFGNVGLFALDAATGEMLWEQRFDPLVTKFGWGPAASPVLHAGRVFVVRDSEESSSLTAYDAATGGEAWRVDREERSNWSTPFVWEHDGRTEIVTPGSGMTRSYDLDGNLLYEFGGGSIVTIATPYAAEGLLFVSSGYSMGRRRPLWAVRPGASGDVTLAEGESANDTIAWSRPDIAPYNPSTLVLDGLLYVLVDRGLLSCYEATTGAEVYERQRLPEGRAFTASPWAYNNLVFCGSEYGETFVIRAGREFEILRRNDLMPDEMIMASPAIADGRLFLRSDRGLYCITRGD
jgi:N-sulfoglucosamine sulfohydrolase